MTTHRRPRQAHAFLACLALSSAMLASCAAIERPAPTADALPPVDGDPQITTRVDDVVRPIDQYLPTADAVLHIARVEEQRTNACLSEHGFAADYRLLTPSLTTFIESAVRNRAARSGMWGLFETSDSAPPQYTLTSDEASVELAPVPEEAVSVCGPDDPNAMNPVLYALGDAVLPDGGPKEPIDDPRFTPVVSAWSECMAGAGFTYATPADPLVEFSNVDEGVSDRQLEIARADMTCKQQTNLVGIAVSIRAAYDKAYIKDHEAELAQVTALLAAYASS